MLKYAVLLILLSTPLWGAERAALVIGNADYQVGRLRNPVNDANDIAASLRAIGFDVVLGTDLSRDDMRRKLSEFRSKLQPGGIAFVYYSGLGVQVDGQNWLLPVSNASIQRHTDVLIDSVSVQDVLGTMEEAGAKLNLLILEAYRDIPSPSGFNGAWRGWAPIDSGSSTLVAYGTRLGASAAEGNGRNSLFTTVLKEALQTPGLSVVDMFTEVSAQVHRESGGAQFPWISFSSNLSQIYLVGDAPTAQSPQLSPTELSQPRLLERQLEPASASRWIAAVAAVLLAGLLGFALRRCQH